MTLQRNPGQQSNLWKQPSQKKRESDGSKFKVFLSLTSPYHPCMLYLPTFTIKNNGWYGISLEGYLTLKFIPHMNDWMLRCEKVCKLRIQVNIDVDFKVAVCYLGNSWYPAILVQIFYLIDILSKMFDPAHMLFIQVLDSAKDFLVHAYYTCILVEPKNAALDMWKCLQGLQPM